MPNIPLLSFSAGELSPLIDARSDVEKYQSGCRHLENFIPRVYGVAERRCGTYYLTTIASNKIFARLLPFIYSADVAYKVELTDRYARFFYGDSLIDGADKSTPYLAADLRKLKYRQVGNVMWLVHPDYAPMKLTRTSASEFSLDEIVFDKGPFLLRNDLIEEGTDAAYMDCSVTDVGGSGTLTCSNGGDGVTYNKENVNFFVAEHEGALFKLTHPRKTTQTKGTSDGSIPNKIVCAPLSIKGTFRFDTHGHWGGTIVLQRWEESAGEWGSSSPYSSWEDYRKWSSTYANNVGDRNVQAAFTESSDNVQYRAVFKEWYAGSIAAELTIDESTQDGIVRVTATDGTIESPSATATVEVVKALSSTDPTRRWAEDAWSDYRGYPSAVTFFEGRCIYGGMMEVPEQVVY